MKVLLACVALGLVAAAGPTLASHTWHLTPKFVGAAVGPDLAPMVAQVFIVPPCTGPVRVLFYETLTGRSSETAAALDVHGVAGPAPECILYQSGLATFEVASGDGSVALSGWAAAPHPGAAGHFRGTLHGWHVEMFSAGV